MRRADREITDKQSIDEIFLKAKIVRIGFFDEGDIYIVPVNFGCECENDEYRLYFHGAKAGRKYELSKACPRVGFEIDEDFSLMEAKEACSYSASYKSIIGSGDIMLVEAEEEKKHALDVIMRHITGKCGWTYNEHMLEKTAVYCLKVNKLSAKMH